MPEYTPEEQKEHRRLWVEALRSGEYAQYLGYLHTNDGFCCLGVACDISGLGEWYKLWDQSYIIRYKISPDNQSYTKLPIEVRNWLGLNSVDGIFSFEGLHADFKPWIQHIHSDFPTSLSSLNDRGVTFDQIATLIEIAEKIPTMQMIST